MEPILIQAEIKRRGGSMSALADECHVDTSSVRQVIFGKIKSRRIAATIALFLGRPVDELWPGQYPAKYSRRSADAMLRLSGAAAMAKAITKAA